MKDTTYEAGGKELFLKQIEDDIKSIQEDYKDIDPKLNKDEYAFNYWILSKLYNLDEEILLSNITDYADKGIDCYVYYPDTNELYLIQNKYYNESQSVKRDDITHFLDSPLASLLDGGYSKSEDLQKIFNRVYKDESAKIYLHFYLKNDKKFPDIDKLLRHHKFSDEIKASVSPEFYNLKDIYDLYYGERFENKISFTANLTTRKKAMALKVMPQDYQLDWMIDSRFIMVNVVDLYDIYNEAKEKGYQLFEENVREFLGTRSINNGIIRTLKDENDRENFFYYNNGITIICKGLSTLDANEARRASNRQGDQYGLKLKDPQIVNGCQTINSIYHVLSKCDEDKIYEEYEKTYVLVKIYVFDENTKQEKKGLDKDIVRYTNSQNGIDEKAFAAKKDYFLNLQKDLKKKGFLLLVKPSDNNTFSQEYKDKRTRKFKEFTEKGKDVLAKFGIDDYKNLKNHMIPLEKMLKVLLAFEENGFVAFTKGNTVLKINSDRYKDFSLNIRQKFSDSNIINLYYLFCKADYDKKHSQDGKSPIPYYLFGFLGKIFKGLEPKDKDDKLTQLFSDRQLLDEVYSFYIMLINRYVKRHFAKHKNEYNLMIKQEIDDALYDDIFEEECGYLNKPGDKKLKEFLEGKK